MTLHGRAHGISTQRVCEGEGVCLCGGVRVVLVFINRDGLNIPQAI